MINKYGKLECLPTKKWTESIRVGSVCQGPEPLHEAYTARGPKTRMDDALPDFFSKQISSFGGGPLKRINLPYQFWTTIEIFTGDHHRLILWIMDAGGAHLACSTRPRQRWLHPTHLPTVSGIQIMTSCDTCSSTQVHVLGFSVFFRNKYI